MELQTKGKGLFLFLSVVSLIIMMTITTVLWWFISPRLHEINNFFADIILFGLRAFYLVVVFGTSFILLTSLTEKNFLFIRPAIRTSINFLFPVTTFLGNFLRIPKDKIRESFVYVNNTFAKALQKKVSSKEILILLPHCLQLSNCKFRITTNINNCVECGKCDISELKKISSKYNVKIAIATGGTLARKIIIENKPKFIIAVACHRDLVEGIKDVFPIPVFGILNFQPEGPCINTKVDTARIEAIINGLLNHK